MRSFIVEAQCSPPDFCKGLSGFQLPLWLGRTMGPRSCFCQTRFKFGELSWMEPELRFLTFESITLL